MEEFYKKISDKLENPPNEATDWSVWDKVEKQLDEKEELKQVNDEDLNNLLQMKINPGDFALDHDLT